MSNLMRADRASAASSLGSFVVRRGGVSFRAWGNEGGSGGEPTAGDDPQTREESAYARGLAEGRRTVEAELAAERAAVAELAETLPNLRAESTLPLSMLIAETVDRLVKQVVGEVEIDDLSLIARAKAAAAMIGEATQPARLRAHPEDAALLGEAGLEVAVVADRMLERGQLLLETIEGWVEDGPAIRLERLRAELDKVAASR